MSEHHPHIPIGPQPYLTGPKGKCEPSRVEPEKPVLEPAPFLTPRNENVRTANDKFWEKDTEIMRYKSQTFAIKLDADTSGKDGKSLDVERRQCRDVVLQSAAQQEKEKEEKQLIKLKSGVPPVGQNIASPRARQGPKDAKSPRSKLLARSPREIKSGWTPVSAAINAGLAEAALSEAAHRKEYASLVHTMGEKNAATARDRVSKQQQLGKQAENLSARRDYIDVRKAAAEKVIDVHRRQHVAQTSSAKDKAADLQKRIAELRAKKDASRREAWLLQAHPPEYLGSTALSPRWNEGLSTDKALKERTMKRTEAATNPPPPQVPSPRQTPRPFK